MEVNAKVWVGMEHEGLEERGGASGVRVDD
jgi:hypothetical protein